MDTTEILDLLNQYSESERNISWFDRIPNCGHATGAFKECLIFPDMDFVLKIPFEFSRNSEMDNACYDEIKTYQSAKEAGVEKVFLETWFIGYLANGRPVYGQAKADYTSNSLPENKKKKYERITQTVSENMRSKVIRGMYDHSVNRLWVEMFISLYGKNFARKFEAWTKETHLTDFHSGNIGYRKDKPIILDYNYCR
jgi:hypothetical protein